MSETTKNVLRTHMKVLQEPLTLDPEPFAGYAAKLGITEDETIELLRYYLSTGVIRRVAGILKHNRAGFVVNAMVAFVIEPQRCDAAGETLAQFPFITHCYRRTAYHDWPYTIYAMVHARNQKEFDEHLEKIRAAVVCYEMAVLQSVKEYKKTAFRM